MLLRHTWVDRGHQILALCMPCSVAPHLPAKLACLLAYLPCSAVSPLPSPQRKGRLAEAAEFECEAAFWKAKAAAYRQTEARHAFRHNNGAKFAMPDIDLHGLEVPVAMGIVRATLGKCRPGRVVGRVGPGLQGCVCSSVERQSISMSR